MCPRRTTEDSRASRGSVPPAWQGGVSPRESCLGGRGLDDARNMSPQDPTQDSALLRAHRPQLHLVSWWSAVPGGGIKGSPAAPQKHCP